MTDQSNRFTAVQGSVVSAIYRELDTLASTPVQGEQRLALVVGAAISAYARSTTYEEIKASYAADKIPSVDEWFARLEEFETLDLAQLEAVIPLPALGEEDPGVIRLHDLEALDAFGFAVMQDWTDADVRSAMERWSR